MTEKLQPLSTQIAIPSQTLVAPNAPVSHADVPRKAETVEEEPYTIKCICNFSDDDGNTIYCDTCDTWQHIDCFYPDSQEEALREDFAHSCAECKPRPLNIQKAIERTKRLGTAPLPRPETGDKKPKRPPSKSHKKKPKPTDLQLNGNVSGQENGKNGSPSDTPHPAKKAKSSHRPTNSTSSQPNKRSPSYGNGRPNGHPPSPATTPPDLPNDFEIHGYSDRFLSLYNSEPDSDSQKTPSNSFSSLAASNSVSLWPRDPQRLVEDTGAQFEDVFQKLPADIGTRQQQLIVQDKKVPTSTATLRWKYLTTPVAIEKDVPLIELHGQIGFQKDYCADPENLWEALSSPLPFVFFHPMLPLCIDTRNEMSPARYVRRSCKPNAVLDTYLSEEFEYHFWLVSDRYIAANEQITLPWDFRLPKSQKARILQLIGLNDDDANHPTEPDMDDAEYQSISSWLSQVLSEYGGCACDLGGNCAFARFHRHYHNRALPRTQAPKKKSRKPKVQTISPTSTGPAANSRAASENHVEDADQDGRTASERSKPPSRDQTPGRQGSLDQPEILTGLTDREKRKLQMAEDSFRKLEQQPPRKKKRTSDGTNPKTKSKNGSSNTGTGGSRYVDAGTGRSKSASPSSTHSNHGTNAAKSAASRTASVGTASRHASMAPRPEYCDAAVQTDPVAGEWYSGSPPPCKPRRRVISLSQRLLNNRHRMRLDEDEKRKHPQTSPTPPEVPTAMDVDPAPIGQDNEGLAPASNSTAAQDSSSPAPAGSDDAPMVDAASVSPTMSKSSAPAQSPTGPTSEDGKIKSPELRVQMPPVPSFGNVTVATSTATTPQSASGPLLQSPFSVGNIPSPFTAPTANGITQPSPVKKKLSLSDYTKSRANKKTSGGLKTPAAEESKPPLDTIVDSPGAEEKPLDGSAQTNGISPVSNTKSADPAL